jgi:signal transduction histidine kinase
MSELRSIQKICASINNAPTPDAAAQTLVNWLGEQHITAIIALVMRPEGHLNMLVSPNYPVDLAVFDWIRAHMGDWQLWEVARRLDAYAQSPISSFLGVPMITKNRTIGLMCLNANASKAFDENSLEGIQTLVKSLAVIIENDELVNTATRRVQELGVINEISRTLARHLGSDEIWEPLHRQISLLFENSSFFIGMYDQERDHLKFPLISEEHILEDSPIMFDLSKAVIAHGIELQFRDIVTENQRLQSMGINPLNHLSDDELAWTPRSWLGIPLRSRSGEIIGLISVQNMLSDSYVDADLSLLMTIAAQLSLALDNARLLEAEQARRKMANTLIDMSRDVSSTLDFGEVLDRILEQMQRIVDYDSASIMLVPVDTHDEQHMIIVATQGLEPYLRGQEVTFISDNVYAQLMLSQQPLVIPDVQKESSWGLLNNFESVRKIRSWVGVPLLVQERVIGMITLDKHTPNFYTEKDASNAFAVAGQAAVAVENARLHAQLQSNVRALEQRNRRLASIHELSTIVSSTLDRDEILNAAARQLTELFGVDHCGIVLMYDKENALLVAEYPPTENIGRSIPVAGSIIFETLAKGGTLAIEDVDNDPIDDTSRGNLKSVGARSVLLAPLIARHRLMGSIGLDSIARARVFTAEEHETHMTIAAQLALAIQNAELYQEAIEANRIKSEFLANVSHELRTPLNSIIGYTEMMLQEAYGAINDSQRDRLLRVHTGGQQLHDLINNVLDLSKIEAGQMTLSPDWMSIHEPVQRAIANVTPQSQAKGLTLTVDVDDNIPQIYVDGQRIRQILTNLLDNAVKFTHTGSVALHVWVMNLQDGQTETGWMSPPHLDVADGEWLAISVSDTGIGIASNDQEYIFDAFRQVDGSSTREYQGSGLGLAITRQFVALHNGHIWIESAVGRGSTFALLLPARPSGSVNIKLPLWGSAENRHIEFIEERQTPPEDERSL